MKFRNYIKLQKEYEEIFDNIFETYYNKGYFGNVNKDDIKNIQYKWFKKVVMIIEHDKQEHLVEYVVNHNNKITREFYSKITGDNIKSKGKDYILKQMLKKKDSE